MFMYPYTYICIFICSFSQAKTIRYFLSDIVSERRQFSRCWEGRETRVSSGWPNYGRGKSNQEHEQGSGFLLH